MPVRRFSWGQPAQICGALHSHGAALVRSRPGEEYVTPAVPIAAVELFRERALPHPLQLVTSPLANFSITRQSARARDAGEWAEVQTALAATFLKHAGLDVAARARLWAEARAKSPSGTGVLISAAIVEPACRPLLRHARPADWFRWLRSVMRRPGAFRRVLRSRRLHPDWWAYLDHHTAARFAETRRLSCP